MVQFEKQRRFKTIRQEKTTKDIANYFVSESDPFRKTKSKTQCQIDDNEIHTV